MSLRKSGMTDNVFTRSLLSRVVLRILSYSRRILSDILVYCMKQKGDRWPDKEPYPVENILIFELQSIQIMISA
jgi:hypothetical protein